MKILIALCGGVCVVIIGDPSSVVAWQGFAFACFFFSFVVFLVYFLVFSTGFQTLDSVSKPSDSECYTPSSEPFIFNFVLQLTKLFQPTNSVAFIQQCKLFNIQ
jgi:hypothetical protein